MRRRVGQPSCAYSNLDEQGTVQAQPIGTDWATIEAAFAAKRTTVAADYTGAR